MKDCIDHGRSKSLTKEGYALQWVPHLKKMKRLHQIVCAEKHSIRLEDVAEGNVVRHKCDNPRCINPEHLEYGSVGDNNRDTSKRGRTTKVQAHHRLLTDAQAQAIREAYVPRKVTMRDLAQQYGVSAQTICDIINGVNYGTLTNNEELRGDPRSIPEDAQFPEGWHRAGIDPRWP